MSSYIKPQDVLLEPGDVSVLELKPLITSAKPVILDVGANIGQTTLEFLRLIPNACIYCFEPDPRAIRKFKANISSPNVQLFECAVGNDNGTVTFNQSSGDEKRKDWDQSGSIRKPKDHLQIWPWVRFESTIEVPIVRLDDWIKDRDIENIDLMWADIQGAEGDLVAGGAQVLKRTRFLYTEYGSREWYEGQVTIDELCEALAPSGLALCRKFEMDALFVNMSLVDAKSVKLPIKRNALCPCGSDLRYKHCHGSYL